MSINLCARKVDGFEQKRHAFVIATIQLICLLPVERKEVQSYLDALETKHIACADKAIEFFNGNNAYMLYRQKFDNWWEANRQLIKYLPEMLTEINQRWPGSVSEELLNADYEAVLHVENQYRN